MIVGRFCDEPRKSGARREGARREDQGAHRALAIAVSARCDDCIAFHVKAAVDRGATRDEIVETLGVAIYMGGGPSVMYASHALAAYSQLSAVAKPAV